MKTDNTLQEREAIKTALQTAKLFVLKHPNDIMAVPVIRVIDEAFAMAARALVAIEAQQNMGGASDRKAEDRDPVVQPPTQPPAPHAEGVECQPEHANEDGWTDWIGPTQEYRMQCCDCSLVHDVEFAVVKGNEVLPYGEYQPTFRMKRSAPARDTRHERACEVLLKTLAQYSHDQLAREAIERADSILRGEA